jgi:hypothetical protein
MQQAMPSMIAVSIMLGFNTEDGVDIFILKFG